MQNQSGTIRRQMALAIEPAMDEKQDEKEKTMNTQLKPVSIIGTIGQGTSKRFAQYTLIGATLVVLLVTAMTMRQTFTHRSSVATNHSGLTTQQRQFLEANTTSLPALVQANVAPVAVSSERAKFLEANINLGMVADAAPSVPSASARKFIEVNTDLGALAATSPAVVTRSAQRFLEVNTDLGMVEAPTVASYPYGEAVTPVRGPR